MIDQQYFFDKINMVSICNFKVPVNSLLRHELYRLFCTKDYSFDRVCDYMLNNNTDITYYNMKNLFSKFDRAEPKKEERKLKYMDSCIDRECSICDVDVCGPITKAFSSEKDLWDINPDPDKCKGAIERLQKLFPLLSWSFNKIKEVRVNDTGDCRYLYESIEMLPPLREQSIE